MGLIERFPSPNPTHTGDITGTTFCGFAVLIAQGIVTKAKMITDLELTAGDQVTLDELVVHYQGLTADNKNKFFSKLCALLDLMEVGFIDDAFFKNQFGLT